MFLGDIALIVIRDADCVSELEVPSTKYSPALLFFPRALH